MGNPRHRRKQKSGSGKLTRRTADKYYRRTSLHNELIRHEWDVNATLRENYERLGLAHDLDKAVKTRKTKRPSEMIKKLEEYAEAPVLHDHKLSTNQHEILQALVAKHKDNYAAMARDIKVNTYQLTEGQLRRQITQMQRQLEDEEQEEGDEMEEDA